uniref:Amidase domain-containing protein n=1 Tax=Acrobeloides nanus TaxID=290746 RepID=A0A914CMS8_9BILA
MFVNLRDHVNAFLDLPHFHVPHAENGPLSNLTFGVKDLIDVAGYKTGCGNPNKYQDAPIASKSAPVVQALLDAGAEFVGKTQTDEIAADILGLRTHLPKAINSAAPDRMNGGSSSGSAAAVSAGLADFALGTDTRGSIRTPASFNGILGLRTTWGRVSIEGLAPLSPRFDTIGWFAKDIEVFETVSKVIFSSNASHVPSGLIPPTLENPTLYRMPDYERFIIGLEAKEEFERILAIVNDTLGEIEKSRYLIYSPEETVEIGTALLNYESWQIHKEWMTEKKPTLHPAVKIQFEQCAKITKESYEANVKREAILKEDLLNLLGNNGVLVLPTVPSIAPLRFITDDAIKEFTRPASIIHSIATVAGCPQLTLPLGKVRGAPFGLSLLGPPHSDEALIALGKKILKNNFF